ncbi:MAG: NERD domain-containing protein [Acidobacteria bacterium]|nr:NERD domain-containing protein [Acidobacteriota bacterium]
MARMIPALNDEQLRAFRSRAEARFYEACRDQLPNEIVVVHSAGWIYRDGRGRVREGEADFTILAPRSGVFAVEVKGGGIAHDAGSGKWYSVDRDGERHEIKNPFRQASNERHALLDQLTGHPTWRQWKGNRLTLGHAVVFPDINDSAALQGPDRPRAIVGVARDIGELGVWLHRVVRFWKQAGDDPLGAQGVRLVEDILRRSIEVRPALRSAIDDAEQKRIRLTANQAKVLRTIGGRRRAVISGGAGTGKTLIAVEKARQLAQGGLQVLLLCYNRPLADALAIGLQDETRVVVLSFHQLYDRRVRQAMAATGRNLLAEAAEAYPGNSDKHRFDVQMPYALALSNEVLHEKFDAVVVDEAQDFSDEYWFAIEELLRDQVNGYLYIFIDQNQALYPRHGNLPVSDEPYYLTSNCRNTAPIHDVGYAFYAGDPIDGPDLPGPAVEREAIDGDEAQADAVARRVRQWLTHEALRPEDVAVLIAKRPKAYVYDLLEVRPIHGSVAWAVEDHGRARSVLVDTVARFKGLEAQAVVLWLGEEVVDEEQWETVYVGSTRAKSLLCVVGAPRTLKALRAK